MNSFKDLIVWQKSISLTSEIYSLTAKLPSTEKFGLRSQICRCAVSIPSNIAEGAGRNSNKEYCQFLSIAQGSAFELESLLIVCCRLKFFHETEISGVSDLIIQIQRMLYSLQLKRKSLLFNFTM
jgi:four helix bundle protein